MKVHYKPAMRAARMFVPPSAFKFMISPGFHTKNIESQFCQHFCIFIFLCLCIPAYLCVLYFCIIAMYVFAALSLQNYDPIYDSKSTLNQRIRERSCLEIELLPNEEFLFPLSINQFPRNLDFFSILRTYGIFLASPGGIHCPGKRDLVD